MVVTKEKCTNLDEVEAKHIIKYEIIFNDSKLQSWGYTRFKFSWKEWKRDGACLCVPSPQKITLRFHKTQSTI
jgi:hypothetical protein